MKLLNNKQSGFTLIEVLISMIILSVALFGLASISGSVIRSNSFSSHFTTATVLAQDKLEELANLPFTDSNLSDDEAGNNNETEFIKTATTDYSDPNNPVDENGDAAGIFTRNWNIWDRTANRKDIAVIVTWQGASGSTKTVSVSTIKVN